MIFIDELLVGFSGPSTGVRQFTGGCRDFEIFYKCAARNKKSKVVTDIFYIKWRVSTEQREGEAIPPGITQYENLQILIYFVS